MKKKSPDSRTQTTILGFQTLGAVVVAYILASRAIDTGSWWQYLGCLLFIVLGIKWGFSAFKNYYGKKR
jgi:hypothetical protein